MLLEAFTVYNNIPVVQIHLAGQCIYLVVKLCFSLTTCIIVVFYRKLSKDNFYAFKRA